MVKENLKEKTDEEMMKIIGSYKKGKNQIVLGCDKKNLYRTYHDADTGKVKKEETIPLKSLFLRCFSKLFYS